jgi:nitrate/nitrite transporter NarK
VNATLVGLAAGIALGFAGAFGGFGAFVLVLVLGCIGLAVGRVVDGQVDLAALLSTRVGERERR